MKAEPLPYCTGNSGDLIKHGMIAEFTKWWCHHNQNQFVFYDPFGGRPWVEPPHKKVIERLAKLENCALMEAQPVPNSRYYGSGHIIKEIVRRAGCMSQVFISDRNEDAVDDLIESGLEKIGYEKFISKDAYSILDCNLAGNEVDLLLLDPFADFLESYDTVLPKIIELVTQEDVAVALFVLSDESTLFAYEKFTALRRRESAELTKQFSFFCPQLHNTAIEGEERYCSEIILFLPTKYSNPQLDELRKNLQQYAWMLTKVLNHKIQFNELS